MANYVHREGDRVNHVEDLGKTGEVVGRVPGNGSIEWYEVQWDHGDRSIHTRYELETAE